MRVEYGSRCGGCDVVDGGCSGDFSDRPFEEGRWASVKDKARVFFGEAVFADWISNLKFVSAESGVVLCGVPNKFVKDWIEMHYSEAIEALIRSEGVGRFGLKIFVEEPSEVYGNAGLGLEGDRLSLMERGEEFGRVQEVHVVGSALNDDFTFDSFVIGRSNEFAYAASKRVAESCDSAYNPFFIYGPVGHGKTHLVQSVARCMSAKKKRVLYITAEKFMYQFVKAIRDKDIVSFKDQFRAVDVLIVDDVQFISGKDSTQEEFFHTFSSLIDNKRQVIISADRSPSDLDGIKDRIRSHFCSGLVVDIHKTSYDLRMAILNSKVARSGIFVPVSVIEFLASKISSNVRELEGALVRVVAHSTLIGRSIDLEMTQEVLRDLLRSYDKQITAEHIQKMVAEHYGVKVADITSSKRSKNIVRPRQVAMFLTKTMTSMSLPKIGDSFGGRDHATVIHSIRKISCFMSEDPSFSAEVAALRKKLDG
ncbi:chromosomal replication initiator protein DnaA [Candidatus Hydrogenosomobacter endosymbioticus]|uniref:Chromosomal replication initiator protein DnaA n=1 Tax=Candidatus Hydrogenosomobacter endosymbioticus TaxID=2558174 RepID=A0ABM7V807_9PROT|nr:chromosomal replication initiator protein DnaA [Candidatus Hydrogenosomobacter endosymbioticus]BDB95868.1 chromosomal replication initiator protein DnaA [Candidatus Hydrogenosomobacter endosymbioticus]